MYEEMQKTYQRFGKNYENVLAQYYFDLMGPMKRLYVDESRPVRGIIFVDGTYEIGAEILLEMFTKYSAVFMVCCCLSPAERKSIGENDTKKMMLFESVSIMRYLSYFFEWLYRAHPVDPKRRTQEKIMVYNSTYYPSLENFLRDRRDAFHRVYNMNYLRVVLSCC